MAKSRDILSCFNFITSTKHNTWQNTSSKYICWINQQMHYQVYRRCAYRKGSISDQFILRWQCTTYQSKSISACFKYIYLFKFVLKRQIIWQMLGDNGVHWSKHHIPGKSCFPLYCDNISDPISFILFFPQIFTIFSKTFKDHSIWVLFSTYWYSMLIFAYNYSCSLSL